MIQDPVADWRELSALYEQADALTGSALREWLAALPADAQKFAPRLEKMLAARARAAEEQFLESLPTLCRDAGKSSQVWEADTRIGAYRLVRHVGSGGMAEVWLAERDDGAFARTVAIKLLYSYPTRAQRHTFVERFRRERDILASLDHPNIAALLDAGVTAEGQPWLALEYVEGRPIIEWCDRERMTIEERVRLFRQVLLAVEHAHARLVIHRDIKPSNVLVASSGGVRLLDFGIAKLLDAEGEAHEATMLTREGGRPLTPQYASPEQLIGGPLTTACDIYSLGLLLYELLSGSPPYVLAGKSPADVEATVVTLDPPPPSRGEVASRCLADRRTDAKGLKNELKPDLDAIVMRALEKLPARRYGSANAMRAELDRWLAHEPVLATLPGPGYRMGKFIRRHRAGVSFGAAAACVAVVAVAFIAWQDAQTRHEAKRALASKDFLLDMFRLSDPDRTKGGDVRADEMLTAGLERANRSLVDQPELRADVLKGIASIEQHLGRYTRADAILRQVATLYTELGQRRDWAKVQLELADNALQMGDVKSAGSVLDGGVSTFDEFRSDSALQARYHDVRGWLLRVRGNLPEAKAELLLSLASATAAYGRNDNRTADAVRGLAEVEAELRDYAAAREHISAARTIAAAATNAGTSDLVGIEMEQAWIEFSAGRFVVASPLFEAAIQHCDRVLGEQNEYCFFARTQQARLLLQIGNFDKALSLLPVLLRETKNEFSPRRQADAAIVASRVLAANDIRDGAVDLRARLRQVVEEAAKGALSSDIGYSAQLALAEVALREGRMSDVETELGGMLAGMDAASDEARPYLARSQMIRGLAAQAEGNHRDALALLGSAESNFEIAFGPDSIDRVLCQVYELPSLLATNRHDRAQRLADDAFSDLQERVPAEAPLLAKIERIRSDLRTPGRGVSPAARSAAFFN